MNTSSFIKTTIIIWIVYSILTFLLNASILNWEGLPGMKEAPEFIWLNFVANLIFAFLFGFIYTKGYEGKGTGEGIRFGLYVGLLIYIPLLFTHSIYYDYPFNHSLMFSVGNIVILLVTGAIVGTLYKPEVSA